MVKPTALTIAAAATTTVAAVAVTTTYLLKKYAGPTCNGCKRCSKRYPNDVVIINLPDWLYEYQKSLSDTIFTTDEEMMKVAIEISSKNVSNETGGPFGCAIFERSTSNDGTIVTKLFAVGANRVTTLNNSTLHGEMVAIQFAQQKLQSYSLRSDQQKYYILATSCEPCCMCLGGTLWSGVQELICGAAKRDAEAIGFNEGPVYDDSYVQLQQAGILIKRNVLQPEAAAVLQHYGQVGVIYNC